VDLLEYLNYTINPTPGAQGLSKVVYNNKLNKYHNKRINVKKHGEFLWIIFSLQDILLYRKPNEAFIRVGEFVNDLRKLL